MKRFVAFLFFIISFGNCEEDHPWEKDQEGIIKFLEWYNFGAGGGSCIVLSCSNLILNPFFIRMLEEKLNETKNSYLGIRVKFYKDLFQKLKNHEYYHRSEETIEYNGEKKTETSIIDSSEAFLNYICEGYITCKTFSYYKNESEDFKKFLNSYNEIETPNIIKIGDYKFLKENDFLDNNLIHKDYFISGIIINFYNGKNHLPVHTVYGHVLYDDDFKKIKRIIILNTNKASNTDRNKYASEMSFEALKKHIESSLKNLNNNDDDDDDNNAGARIGKFYLIKKESCTEEELKYWKSSSLGGKFHTTYKNWFSP